MEIAIVGGGVAGLMAAFELDNQGHQVAVFEKSSSIGGHARSVNVPIGNGGELLVEMGVIMYDPINIHPVMSRYVGKFGLAVQEFPLNFSFENQENQLYWTTQSRYSGFLRDLSVLAEITAKSIANGKISKNLAFLWELHRYMEMMKTICSDSKYQHMSVADFIEHEDFTYHFFENWFFPQILCWWGASKKQAWEASIQVVTESFYLVSQTPQYCFKKGWKQFIRKLAEPYVQKIRLQSPVKSVRRLDKGVELTTTEKTERFDAVVFAAPPSTASRILQDKSAKEAGILNAFETTATHLYLHRDPAWMPQHEEWGTVNLVQDEKGDFCTYWCGVMHESKPNVFLTWGDRLSASPNSDDLIRTETFLRTLPNVDYTHACRAIRQIQGNGGIWYCGAHVDALNLQEEDNVPSVWHENALRSGLAVANAIQKGKIEWTNKLTI